MANGVSVDILNATTPFKIEVETKSGTPAIVKICPSSFLLSCLGV